MTDWDISPVDLKKRLEKDPPVLIDVREPHEWDIGRIEGAKLIPLGDLPKRINELNTADEIVLYCKVGGRSMKALQLLNESGFKRLKNLRGGINAWSREVDAKVPLY